MKTYNNITASLRLIAATCLAFLKNSLRVIAWTFAVGLCASLASQARAEITTQTIPVPAGSPTVTIIVNSATPVTVTATTAQPAQYNTSASVQNITPPDNGRETSFAVPKSHGVNMYFMFGPTWVDAHNRAGSVDLYGLTFAFGWRAGKHSKFQIDSSLLFGSHDEVAYHYSAHVDYLAGLDTFTYNFVIPFDKKGIVELRLGPSVGLTYMHTNYSNNYYQDTASDGKFALAGGGGIGLTFHTSKRFMIDLGFRYMAMSQMHFNWGKIPGTETSASTLSAGWKF